jgi:hypothetical protein
VAIQLRGLEAKATEEQVKQIRAANEALQSEYERVDLMDGFRESFAGFFEDVISGTGSIKDAFKNMLDDINSQIARRISQNWVDQLFGQMGSSQGGSAGGGWLAGFASLFSSNSTVSSQGSLFDLFGSSWGFATGGYASPRSVNRVNENGPELFRVGSRDYLLTGNRGGTVVPSHMAGGGAPFVQNINVQVQGRADLRSSDQIGVEAARRAQIATARNR